MGRKLMESGAEIYRVEESVSRLLSAYGVQAQVFAIPNCLIVSVTALEGQPITQMYRIPAHGTDIELLERCNDLCRQLCREVPPLEEALARVEKLEAHRRQFPAAVVLLLGYMMASCFFSLFFGGSARDGVCAAFAGLAGGLCLLGFARSALGSNVFFRTVISSGAASFTALLLVQGGIGVSLWAATIGALMPLVPGMALTNAMREIMAGDLISGLNRTAEAILVATAIALGTVLPLVIGQVHNDGMQTASAWEACVWAGLACVGFGSVFNIHGWGIWICGFGAALGWMAYLEALALTGTDIGAAFLAAMVISAFSEVMARLRRCPVTGYLQVALLPLVPGAGI